MPEPDQSVMTDWGYRVCIAARWQTCGFFPVPGLLQHLKHMAAILVGGILGQAHCMPANQQHRFFMHKNDRTRFFCPEEPVSVFTDVEKRVEMPDRVKQTLSDQGCTLQQPELHALFDVDASQIRDAGVLARQAEHEFHIRMFGEDRPLDRQFVGIKRIVSIQKRHKLAVGEIDSIVQSLDTAEIGTTEKPDPVLTGTDNLFDRIARPAIDQDGFNILVDASGKNRAPFLIVMTIDVNGSFFNMLLIGPGGLPLSSVNGGLQDTHIIDVGRFVQYTVVCPVNPPVQQGLWTHPCCQ